MPQRVAGVGSFRFEGWGPLPPCRRGRPSPFSRRRGRPPFLSFHLRRRFVPARGWVFLVSGSLGCREVRNVLCRVGISSDVRELLSSWVVGGFGRSGDFACVGFSSVCRASSLLLRGACFPPSVLSGGFLRLTVEFAEGGCCFRLVVEFAEGGRFRRLTIDFAEGGYPERPP